MGNTFRKDPQAVLDYCIDWSEWLAEGETITEYTVTPSEGITVDSHAESGGQVVMWLSGGTGGVNYSVTCHITTSTGREDDRTISVLCRQR